MRTSLPRARTTLVTRNGMQFERVAEGAAALTVTDQIEASLSTALDKRLCHGEPLTVGYKAFMLPQHEFAWQQYVNAFLEQRRSEAAITGAPSDVERWLRRLGSPLQSTAPIASDC